MFPEKTGKSLSLWGELFFSLLGQGEGAGRLDCSLYGQGGSDELRDGVDEYLGGYPCLEGE